MAGAAKVMLEFARAINEQEGGAKQPRIQFAVVSFSRAGVTGNHPVQAAFAAAGASVEVIHETSRYDRRVVGELERLASTWQADIVLSNSVKGHFLAQMARLPERCRWIAYHHGYTRTSWRTLLYNELDRWSLRGASRVATVCQAFARDLRAKGIDPDRISVIPIPVRQPGLETAAHDRRALRERLGVSSSTLLLLNVGRLSAEKGQSDLMRAISVLQNRRPGLRFQCVIVGDGPERERLERLKRRLRVDDQVQLAGYRNDVQSFYFAADAFVLPSHSEGCPNVLLEALATKLAVVATAVGGVPEFVRHEKDALLVRAKDPESLAGGLQRVLESEPLRSQLSLSGSDVIQRHCPADFARRLIACFQKALASAR